MAELVKAAGKSSGALVLKRLPVESESEEEIKDVKLVLPDELEPGRIYAGRLPGRKRAAFVRKRATRESSFGMMSLAQAFGLVPDTRISYTSREAAETPAKSAVARKASSQTMVMPPPPPPPARPILRPGTVPYPYGHVQPLYQPSYAPYVQPMPHVHTGAQAFEPTAFSFDTSQEHRHEHEKKSGLAHTCLACGKYRSANYQSRHPIAPGETPRQGYCRRCIREQTSSEESEVIHPRRRRPVERQSRRASLESSRHDFPRGSASSGEIDARAVRRKTRRRQKAKAPARYSDDEFAQSKSSEHVEYPRYFAQPLKRTSSPSPPRSMHNASYAEDPQWDDGYRPRRQGEFSYDYDEEPLEIQRPQQLRHITYIVEDDGIAYQRPSEHRRRVNRRSSDPVIATPRGPDRAARVPGIRESYQESRSDQDGELLRVESDYERRREEISQDRPTGRVRIFRGRHSTEDGMEMHREDERRFIVRKVRFEDRSPSPKYFWPQARENRPRRDRSRSKNNRSDEREYFPSEDWPAPRSGRSTLSREGGSDEEEYSPAAHWPLLRRNRDITPPLAPAAPWNPQERYLLNPYTENEWEHAMPSRDYRSANSSPTRRRSARREEYEGSPNWDPASKAYYREV